MEKTLYERLVESSTKHAQDQASELVAKVEKKLEQARLCATSIEDAMREPAVFEVEFDERSCSYVCSDSLKGGYKRKYKGERKTRVLELSRSPPSEEVWRGQGNIANVEYAHPFVAHRECTDWLRDAYKYCTKGERLIQKGNLKRLQKWSEMYDERTLPEVVGQVLEKRAEAEKKILEWASEELQREDLKVNAFEVLTYNRGCHYMETVPNPEYNGGNGVRGIADTLYYPERTIQEHRRKYSEVSVVFFGEK